MKKWYVAQVFTGHEVSAKSEILRLAEIEGLSDQIFEIAIPEENVEIDGEITAEKLFPGYLMINADMDDEIESLVKRSPKVTGFAGGGKPSPLSAIEEEQVFDRSKVKAIPRQEDSSVSVGLEVSIAKGPFAGFSGIVENIDSNTGKIKIVVSIFGRMTPIDVSLDQLKK